jgi:hypothetical protein
VLVAEYHPYRVETVTGKGCFQGHILDDRELGDVVLLKDINGTSCQATFTDIQPLFLEANLWYAGALACASCHNSDISAASANMDLSSYAGILAGSRRTSAEFVCSLIYQFPLGIVWGSEVSGHPEQTEEKIVGRPDLGKLNRGEEDVVWTNFSQIPAKIVDEINRLPETKQSMILDGVDRGNWEYLNEMIINDEYCLFATANYQDGGTSTIIPPLMDRFDVMVESRYPGANLSFLIGKTRRKDQVLRHPQYERELHRVLKLKVPYLLLWEIMT